MRRIASTVFVLSLSITSAGLHAETHRFPPKAFVQTFSAAHVPVLRIKSGDTVATATVEDPGIGAFAHTGPFYVEEAEPGDLLVVTLDRLEPSRDVGYSTSNLAPAAVDPGAFRGRPDPMRFSWAVDKVRGVVRLDLRTVSARVNWDGRFGAAAVELPLSPTLGSIAVAPSGDGAAEASTAGPFGGGMLAAGLTAGTRVMLPVLQPGALLFLGRGLARKGDGAVTGGGIEVPLDVTFSVEVVKRRSWPHSSVVRPSTVVGEFDMGWPRVETVDHLVTVGTAASLQEALQHATTELHHWLDDDFGLNEKSVSIVLGQALEYEVASVGERFTVAAKIRRNYLPRVPSAP